MLPTVLRGVETLRLQTPLDTLQEKVGVGQQEVPQCMVPAQAGLSLLQHVKYVGLPQEGHDLIVVSW